MTKYIDETERQITTALRWLRVPNVSDVPQVVGELLGTPHPKLPHLYCARLDVCVDVEVLDVSTVVSREEKKVFVKRARITAHYEVPQ